jgi:hypothetical protein
MLKWFLRLPAWSHRQHFGGLCARLQDFGLAPAGIANLSACLLMWNGTAALRRYAGMAAGVILKNVAVGTAAPNSGCVSISNMTD